MSRKNGNKMFKRKNRPNHNRLRFDEKGKVRNMNKHSSKTFKCDLDPTGLGLVEVSEF